MCDQECECATDRSAIPVAATCRKCKNSAFILLDKVHAECEACFLESCNKKIRSAIGRSQLLSNNDSVLLAHSGGPSSSALLDLLQNSFASGQRREQKFRPCILHIDSQIIEQMRYGCDKLEAETRAEKLRNFLVGTKKRYPDWKLFWTTLESIASTPPDKPREFLDPDSSEHIIDVFKSIANLSAEFAQNVEKQGDLTSMQDYAQKCIRDLINSAYSSIKLHVQIDLKLVFVGSNATRLANEMLVKVILGEGATVQDAVSICDTTSKVPIMRPLRDFSSKEIAYYLKARGIDASLDQELTTYKERKSCIQRLTEDFLGKLNTDYPATYNTLLRTGSKMQTAASGSNQRTGAN